MLLLTTIKEEVLNNLEQIKQNELYCQSLMIRIVQNEDAESLNILLDAGCDINARDIDMRTAAFYIEDTSIPFIEMLVEKGLNLHAINAYGENILHRLSSFCNEEVMAYVLSKGLDPYQQDFRERDMFDFGETDMVYYLDNGGISHDFIREHSLVSKENSINYGDAIRDKNYELAFRIVEQELMALGGIEKLFKPVVSRERMIFINRLYATALMNKKYDIAYILTKAFLQNNTSPRFSMSEQRIFGLELALLRGDTELLKEIIEFYRYRSEDEFDVKLTFQTHIISKILNLDAYYTIPLSGASERFAKNDYLISMLQSDPIIKELPMFEALEEKALEEDSSSNTKSEKLYSVGLIYLHLGDDLQAKYFFNEVVKFADDIGYVTSELPSAMTMLDYLNTKSEVLA